MSDDSTDTSRIRFSTNTKHDGAGKFSLSSSARKRRCPQCWSKGRVGGVRRLQVKVANDQLAESQHLAAASATLDFIDRVLVQCVDNWKDKGPWATYLPNEEENTPFETGEDRIWRRKGEMIDRLRDGGWTAVNSAYDGVKDAVCSDMKAYLPEHAVDPRFMNDQDRS